MKKTRGKANGNGSPTVTDRQIVQALRAKGLSGDVISEILNVNKNTLRARHALALHIGRAKLRQQKAEAGELTFAEMCAADAILSWNRIANWSPSSPTIFHLLLRDARIRRIASCSAGIASALITAQPPPM